jgi:glycerol-3-phosphate cytidylyltransferase
MLEYCASLGDELVVSLNTDDFVKRYKGKPPIMSYEERKEVLLSTKFVDTVMPNYEGEDSKPAILESGASIVAIGMDWLEKDYCKQMNFTPDWLSKNEIILCYIPRTKGVSTTHIKERI